MLLYEASNVEEPCAGKPHAGICERAVGKPACSISIDIPEHDQATTLANPGPTLHRTLRLAKSTFPRGIWSPLRAGILSEGGRCRTLGFDLSVCVSSRRSTVALAPLCELAHR